MSRVSITEASRQFGIATNTIRRRVRQGDLTPFSRQHGRKTRYYFDVSDLVRVFGEPTSEPKSPQTSDSSMNDAVAEQNRVLRSEIQGLEQEKIRHQMEKEVWREKEGRLQDQIHGLQAQLAMSEKHLGDFRQLLAPQLESPKSFMARVRGVFG